MKTAIKEIWEFVKGFFSDQAGTTSSKRLGLYAMTGLLYKMVCDVADGKPVNDYLIYGVFISLLFCLGAITSEFFKKDSSDLKKPE